MKERQFKDVKGFENINTPLQLDTFESPAFKALKDRFIFDLSKTMGYNNNYVYTSDYYTDDDTNPILALRKYFLVYDNYTYYDQSYESTLGIPGNMEVIVKDYPAISDDPDFVPEPPISYIDEIPLWNKDAILYVGSKFTGAYGQGAGTDLVNSFRSGYIEMTIKTNNNNCLVGYGSAKAFSTGIYGVLPFAQASSESGTIADDQPVFINSDIAIRQEPYSNLNEFSIEIENGKLVLKYLDEYGDNAQSFKIVSNTTISDNEWHHIVINIGKPGTIRKNGKKSNKRFIEIWIDGKSDIVNFDAINNKQIVFPTINWLFGNPTLSFKPISEGWDTPDFGTDNDFVGNAETEMVLRSRFNPIGDSIMFSGQLQHFVAGLNMALSKEEIETRYTLYKFNKYVPREPLTANAKLVQPVVSANKKRALRLFWKDEDIIDGVQLDNSFVVDTVCVTHKTINSATEVYNADIASDKTINVLPNIRAAFTDNVNIFGPGKLWTGSLSDKTLIGFGGLDAQTHTYAQHDAISFPDWNPAGGYQSTQSYDNDFTNAAVIDLPFSGLWLNDGDRILLTNQIHVKENGVYVFNGNNSSLTRDPDYSSPGKINNGVVYVSDGYFAETYWMMSNTVSSMSDPQSWVMLDSKPEENTLLATPIFHGRYSNNNGDVRFIDLQDDINLNDYDLITFMNYPKSFDSIYNYFVEDSQVEVKEKYNDFIDSLKIAASNGSKLFVSSPMLAEDLGIVAEYDLIPQLQGEIDPQAASVNPFEPSEPSDQYFDTHRNNKYHVATTVPGLTDKETWIMTDFINYIPKNQYDNEQWHAKYSYKQFGLQEGNEMIIPGLSLISTQINDKLPGFRQNAKMNNNIYAVAPNKVLAGTVVTKLGNIYCDEGNLCQNPYDDYATTIVIHNGQLLGNYPINGKIFVNCVEDGYTFSRQEYNIATIQNVPVDDPNETIATLGWQYSTRRLSRKPQKFDIKQLTEYGQTVPTNGGGGPIIQGPTNSSNGIIRSATDSGNKDYESDLYPTVEEEIYPIQEIPVLSMTWLGLNWLAE